MSIQQIAGIPPPTSSRLDGTSVGQAQRPPASVSGAGVSVVQAGNVSGAVQSAQASAAAATSGNATASSAAANQNRREGVSQESLRESVERAREIVESQVRDLSFAIDDRTGELIVQVVDRESQEVIRQIPSEEMLRLAERLEEMSGQSEPGMFIRREV